MRTTRQVLEDHLEKSKSGTVDEDLRLNFAENVVMLTTFGVFRGHEGMKHLAKLLREQLPEMTLTYEDFQVEGKVGFLEWSADSGNTKVKDGADSYVVRNGLIVAQTIHYTVQKKDQLRSDSLFVLIDCN
ncbi:nuclear transport factor 2 family protein [Pontibacter actiniarum]|uniref:SnoaL-like polyketide cyclase n=1 Tax=Pontibacter actiniarum TaxID=323450 RepID=A0A1X9YYT7_9BACT|nr:nuclear transport factor 2 family protein [Pontibacter actiniarum]ARS38140.1 SnoaL-like polyketide cyclase [Pontibacter actiniarum]MDX5420244.1 nuclear transport factor 2 family protein [Hymenobacteraceae bacterium]